MYWKHHTGQLSITDFHMLFGGTLDPENRWVVLRSIWQRETADSLVAV